MKNYTSKRYLLLVVISLSFILGVNAQYVVTISKGDLSYSISNDYSYAVVSGNSCPNSSSVTIDAKLSYNARTIPVTEIGDYAFQGSGISSVSIPGSVTKVGRNAFYNCSNLTSVYIEDSDIPIVFSSVGNECFGNDDTSKKCITTLYIGRNLLYNTSRYPFYSQQKLTHVTISDKVTSLPPGLFYSCRSLATITLPSSLKTIGSSVFAYCTSLRTVNNYDSNPNLKSVSHYLFNGCTCLSKAYIPKNATYIDDHAFYGCSSIQSLYLPESIDTIGPSAFNGCTSLSEIEIAESDKKLYIYNLGSTDFEKCPIESILFGRNISQISTAFHSFGGLSTLKSVIFSDKVTYIDDYLLYGDIGVQSLVIPGSVTKVGKYSLDFCTGLKHLTFEQSDEELTFYCNQTDGLKDNVVLESLSINRPIHFTSESNSPFKNKTTLKEVVFGGSLRKLYGDLFGGSNAVQSITLDTDLTISGVSYLFGELQNLSTLTLGEHCSSVPTNLYKSGVNLKNVYCLSKEPATIPDKFFNGLSLMVKVPDYCSAVYKSVAAWANNGNNFIYCDNDYESIMTVDEFIEWAAVCDTLDRVSRLTLSGEYNSTTLWTSLKKLSQLSYLDMANVNCVSIPSSQFANSSLYTFVPPVTLATIGAKAFQGCVNLHADFDFTAENVVIDDYAFDGCENLSATFKFGTGVNYVKIGKCAFKNCTNYSAPFAFTSRFDIGESAFENCAHISDVTFASSVADETPSTFGDFAFANTAITKMTVPAYVDKLPKALWRGCESLSSVTFSNADLGMKVSTVGILNPDGSLYQILPAKISSNYTIPSSITAIGEYAFADLDCLQSVTIPETVTSIGAYAFHNCANLSKVTVDVKKSRYTPLAIPTTAFNGVYNHATLYLNISDRTLVPKTLTSYMKATGWRSFKNIDSPTAQYVINVKSSSYGKITPSARVSEAGKTITLSATPIDGYTFVKFILTGATLSTSNSFIMPASEVTVDAEYKVKEPDFYMISYSTPTHGKVNVATKAAPDAQVTVTFVPDEGYKLQSWTLNGTAKSASETKFTMPHKDVTITATFVKIQSVITIDKAISNGSVKAYVNGTLVQGLSGKANWHDMIKLVAEPSANYAFVKWNVSTAGQNVLDTLKNTNPVSFLMPGKDVTVSVTFEKITYPVSIDSTIKNGSISTNVKTASPGDTVSVTITPNDEYVLSSWSAGDGVKCLGDSAFIMPNKNVVLTASFAPLIYNITVDPNIQHGKVDFESDKVLSYGEMALLIAVPDEDCSFIGWSAHDVNGNVIVVDSVNATMGSFKMPNSDVVVSAMFEQNRHNVAIDEQIANGFVSLVPETDVTYVLGDTVWINAEPTDVHYMLSSWKVLRTDGDELDVIPTDENAAYFLMPASDVTVSASFEQYLYDLTVADVKNGTVSVADTLAAAGDTIVVTMSAADDFVLEAWSAGDDIVVVSDSSFVMPSHDVMITASFVRQTHVVVIDDDITNGAAFLVNETSDFVFGDSVTIVAEPIDSLYYFAQWTVSGLADSIEVPAADTLRFAMPANDVFVSASFEKYVFAITAEVSEGGMIVVDSLASPCDTVRVQFVADDDYEFQSWSVSDATTLGESTFLMPFNNVSVSATFVRKVHHVSTQVVGDGEIEGYVDKDYVYGDTVSVTAHPNYGYEFVNWAIEGVAGVEESLDSVLTFTVDTCDVIVTAIFQIKKYPIILPADMEGGSVAIEGDLTEAAEGDTIIVYAIPSLGYDFDEWVVEGAEITYPLSTTSFVMPNHAVSVSALFKEMTAISAAGSSVKVAYVENGILVDGLLINDHVSVIASDGSMVYDAKVDSRSIFIYTREYEKGIYMLKVNQSIYKLFIH